MKAFFEEHNIEHVDLLKIDTEGAEYLILPSPGFARVASKIDYIIGEAHYVDCQLIPDFIPATLKEHGFTCEFLPIDNMYLTFDIDTNGEKRSYKIHKQTLFFAKRI